MTSIIDMQRDHGDESRDIDGAHEAHKKDDGTWGRRPVVASSGGTNIKEYQAALEGKVFETSAPQGRVRGDAAQRKAQPIVSGCLDYFPDALLAVANLSKIGNDQHNPGQPLHWARGKSQDHADTAVRHLMDRGTLDTDGVRHSTKAAWRALAVLQEEIECELGLPPSRASK